MLPNTNSKTDFRGANGSEHTERRSGAYTSVREHPSTGANDRCPIKFSCNKKLMNICYLGVIKYRDKVYILESQPWQTH